MGASSSDGNSFMGMCAGIAIIMVAFFGGFFMLIGYPGDLNITTILFFIMVIPGIGCLVGMGLIMRNISKGDGFFGSGSFGGLTKSRREKDEKSYVHEPPDFCSSCGASLSAENVEWVGPLTLKCPYCGKSHKTVKREI